MNDQQRASIPLALYVHFPWCVRKCPYCDFNSHPLKGTLDESGYLQALLVDLAVQLETAVETPITSVFFGGGTPSLFSAAAFEAVLQAASSHLAADVEITMEANPGTTEHHNFADYRAAGVNRLSIGAQSFDDAQLIKLGRIHNAAETYKSFDAARKAGFENINLDLMYGLIQQTREAALFDLDCALAMQPEHLSWYQLTLEPRTEFAKRPPELSSDIMLEAIEQAGYDRLANAGMHRYEVSAYARPGSQCRHNLNYWSFGDYIGIGAGAHGKLTKNLPCEIVRTTKARQPRLYLADPNQTRHETLDIEQLPIEFMLNALRLTDGVALELFEQRTGLPLDALNPMRERRVSEGLLRSDRLATTRRGFTLLDSLVQDYL